MTTKRKTAKSDYDSLAWRDAPDLLSPPQAARLLGMHVNTIDKWIRAGKLDCTYAGNRRKIAKTDLAAHVGLTLNSNGGIGGDDGTLLAEYAARFEAAIDRLRTAQAAHAEAIQDIQTMVDEMKGQAEN